MRRSRVDMRGLEMVCGFKERCILSMRVEELQFCFRDR